MAPPVPTLSLTKALPEAPDVLVPLPLAGLGGAKALILLVIVALPVILILGTLLRRGKPR